MKYALALIIMIAFNISGMTQDAPKKANLIVFTSDSIKDFDLFKECINILKDEGYTFNKLDKDFNFCSTQPINPKGASFSYRMDLSVNKYEVEIRSYVILHV